VWSILREWCADLVAVTRRGRSVPLVAFVAAVVLTFGLVVLRRAGGSTGTILPLLLLVVLVPLAAYQVVAARRRLHRAACLPLSDPQQPPIWHGHVEYAAPTAVTLYRLAAAVDSVRRAKHAEANDLLPTIDRDLLRDDEQRLLSGLRAMITLSLGDPSRAAQQAIGVLPTGSDDIDAALGRLVLADAWRAEARLMAIESAWREAGVDGTGDSPLDRLQRLVKLRYDASELQKVNPRDAALLLEEAYAVGDDQLRSELHALATQQRGYR
jgi:hypothetical protein